MTHILIIHGAGMNMRGKVQTEIFGTMTLPEYDAHIRTYAAELDLEIEIFHSNIEGEVVNRLYAANDAGVRRRDLQSRRVLARLSGAGGRDRPGEVPDDRGAYFEPGATRPGVRHRNGQPRDRRRVRR